MKIRTKYLGETEISVNHLLRFPQGLPGFPEEKKFILMELPNGGTFQVLQSVQTEELAFIVASPYAFYSDYTFELDDAAIEALQISKPEDVSVYSIVTVRDPFSSSTMNLKAPLVINSSQLLGKQHILKSDLYQTKTPIIQPNAVPKGE